MPISTKQHPTEIDAMETYLLEKQNDFITTYMAVRDIQALIVNRPSLSSIHTVNALEAVLNADCHTSQRKSYFLYRLAAQTLTKMITLTTGREIQTAALDALKKITTHGITFQHRASAEALGSLPLKLPKPIRFLPKTQGAMPILWEDLLEQLDLSHTQPFLKCGRSLVATSYDDPILRVIKLGIHQKAALNLHKEIGWMSYLKTYSTSMRKRFDIPRPVSIKSSKVFQIINFPGRQWGWDSSAKPYFGICFLAPRKYFDYPNDPRPHKLPDKSEFKEIILRNAWLMGSLASLGIIHTAPIPLFHNRVQASRRSDQGLYEWQKSGRLDRWLHSSLYPNFSHTGLRDFEHFEHIVTPGKLYHYIGIHLLSLILVIGSYFRNQAPDEIGYDENAKAVDTRHLFDKHLFQSLLEGTFGNYYQAFTGINALPPPLIQMDGLVDKLIEAMGIDCYMEECLRIRDQREMSENDFRRFLASRGFSPEVRLQFIKDQSDITIQTGPHLGGFNQKISVPDLTTYLATAAAIIISDKYRQTLA